MDSYSIGYSIGYFLGIALELVALIVAIIVLFGGKCPKWLKIYSGVMLILVSIGAVVSLAGVLA